MSRHLVAVVAVMALLLTLPTTLAAAQDQPFEGYCQGGKPVITKWDPILDKDYEPICVGSVLGLRQKQIPGPTEPKEPAKYPDPPADWSSWAQIWLNNYLVVNPYADVIPFVTASTGRTLVPLRMVTEAMGGKAEWDAVARKVTIRLSDKYMELTIDRAEAVANGKPVTLDQPPILWMDRTMVPLRVIAEAFGAEVKWTESVRRVDIILPGVTCAPGYCLDYV